MGEVDAVRDTWLAEKDFWNRHSQLTVSLPETHRDGYLSPQRSGKSGQTPARSVAVSVAGTGELVRVLSVAGNRQLSAENRAGGNTPQLLCQADL